MKMSRRPLNSSTTWFTVASTCSYLVTSAWYALPDPHQDISWVRVEVAYALQSEKFATLEARRGSQTAREEGIHIHLTPYCFSMFEASSRAFLFPLYHIATFAPASANACATTNPMPAPAPVTMAVRPFKEKRGRTLPFGGAAVLLCVKFPRFMAPSDIFADI